MTRHGPVGTVAGVALLAGVALHLAGGGALATPPLRSWHALGQWYDATGPATAIIVVVRLGAMVAALWLATAGGLQLLARRVRAPSLQWLARSISPQLVRTLAQGAAGLSVTAGLIAPATLVGPAGDPPGTAVMVPLDVPPTTTTPPTTTPVPAPPPPRGPVAPPAPSPPPAAEEVVVAAGDSFWSIAVDEVTGGDLVTYWRALIDANRDRLVDRSNPDLLYPGQVLRLP